MKIHLRKKKLKSGKISLYLEYYKGNSKTPDGKRKILRDFEYLDLYLFPNPETLEERKTWSWLIRYLLFEKQSFIKVNITFRMIRRVRSVSWNSMKRRKKNATRAKEITIIGMQHKNI